MNRRELLARTGALGAVALGGCLERYGVSRDDETTEAPPTLADTSFEVTDAGCGRETSEATVEFDDGNEAVVVTGTVPGSNTCYTAELADASFDPDAGRLEVTVESVDDAGEDEACGQCVVEIEYEATVSFSGGLPATVSVVHDATGESETVATADRPRE